MLVRRRRDPIKAGTKTKPRIKTSDAATEAQSRSPLPTPPPNGGLKRKRNEAIRDSGEIPIVSSTTAGNFIKGQQSLVVRSGHASQYSEKYRDGVVDRILSGKTSISNVRDSLKLSEQDVVDWIKQAMDRKIDRIDELKMQVKELEQRNPLNPPNQRIGPPDSARVRRIANDDERNSGSQQSRNFENEFVSEQKYGW